MGFDIQPNFCTVLCITWKMPEVSVNIGKFSDHSQDFEKKRYDFWSI